jgi:hypothetical protein
VTERKALAISAETAAQASWALRHSFRVAGTGRLPGYRDAA